MLLGNTIKREVCRLIRQQKLLVKAHCQASTPLRCIVLKHIKVSKRNVCCNDMLLPSRRTWHCIRRQWKAHLPAESGQTWRYNQPHPGAHLSQDASAPLPLGQAHLFNTRNNAQCFSVDELESCWNLLVSQEAAALHVFTDAHFDTATFDRNRVETDTSSENKPSGVKPSLRHQPVLTVQQVKTKFT